MFIKDSAAGLSNSVSEARSLQELYHTLPSDNTSVINSKVKDHFQSYITDQLKQHVMEDRKLKTYALFKTTLSSRHILLQSLDLKLGVNFQSYI